MYNIQHMYMWMCVLIIVLKLISPVNGNISYVSMPFFQRKKFIEGYENIVRNLRRHIN